MFALRALFKKRGQKNYINGRNKVEIVFSQEMKYKEQEPVGEKILLLSH